jgi:hypothetical protein
MSQKLPSKDGTLEVLDFIVTCLKEHEKDLDRLIQELVIITEKLRVTGALTGKVEKVEQRISGLQNEIGRLVNYLSTARREATVAMKEPQKTETLQANVLQSMPTVQGPPVLLRCKHWEDFQTLAFQAHMLSFMIKESEKTFQTNAIQNNQIVTYVGELPKPALLVKAWLSKQLEISEKRILEGVLAIG